MKQRESVTVPLAAARDGALPMVCFRSGKPADGRAPITVGRKWMGLRGETLKIPLTQSNFNTLQRLRKLQMQTQVAAMALAVLAVAFGSKPRYALICVAVAVAALAAHRVCGSRIGAMEPDAEVDTRAGRVVLHGAHPAFARAVTALDG